MLVWGVGFIGAGPGVFALHAPTIARVGDEFRIVAVVDGGSGRARAVADAHHSVAAGSVDEVMANPAVDVVAICSPPDQHAAHIRLALAAGKRAIFCEKPVAVAADDARDVLAECVEAGALLVVGVNHLFDPAWARAKHHLDASGAPIGVVTVTLALAPNSRYHDLVSGIPSTNGVKRPPLDLANPALCATIVRQLVVGLAVHDLPLLRDMLPEFEGVEFARAIPPIGFDLGLRASGALVRFSAVMLADGAETMWRLAISTANERVEVEFPPPFVHSGSAATTVRDSAGRQTTFRTEPLDGYEAEWRALAALLRGERAMEYAELLADAEVAIAIADAAGAAVWEGMTR
jgi:predicted dehydrogenase